MSAQDDFDPLDPSFVADPHPRYAALRERCPVAHSERWDFFVLTTYDDIVAAATNPRLFSSEQGITVPPNEVSGRRAPMHFDPPEHTRFRRAMNAPFRDERLWALEPRLRAVARELLSAALAERDTDFAAAYVSPLTSQALAAFLGLDSADGDFLDEHSLLFENAQFRYDGEAAEEQNLVLYDFARKIVTRRRELPLDPRDDFTTALLDLVDHDGDLDDEFVAGALRQLFIAAHVAPRVAIAGVIAHLARDADLQRRLRDDPSLVPAAVEELLRLHTPNQGFSRTVREDVEIGGRWVPAGTRVAFAYPSANRDARYFPDPDRFDLNRNPKRHLAFGSGAHKCAGATLARLELRVAVAELLAASTSFELSREPVPVGWPMTGPLSVHLRAVPRKELPRGQA
ncbi:cytochrome P450 [Amycolatopsis sacchari]|uniref:cytochrome P450 n=1 Tax=Amycolatopsis sacchari TaxID=115433 RepID=UPI003D71B4A2